MGTTWLVASLHDGREGPGSDREATWRDEPMLTCDCDCGRPGVHVELGEDSSGMRRHGSQADEEASGDLTIRAPLGNETQDIDLPMELPRKHDARWHGPRR